MKNLYHLLLSLTVFFLAGASTVFAQTGTFNYTGTDQTCTVPSGVTALTVELWGAGGGVPYAGGGGGGGAYVTGTLSVIPGETLTLVVGQQGAPEGGNTYGGGGSSGGVGEGITSNTGAGGGVQRFVSWSRNW